LEIKWKEQRMMNYEKHMIVTLNKTTQTNHSAVGKIPTFHYIPLCLSGGPVGRVGA